MRLCRWMRDSFVRPQLRPRRHQRRCEVGAAHRRRAVLACTGRCWCVSSATPARLARVSIFCVLSVWCCTAVGCTYAGNVFVGTVTAGIVCLDAATGTCAPRHSDVDISRCGRGCDGGTSQPMPARRLGYSNPLRNVTGVVKWSIPVSTQTPASPAIGADGTVYIGSSDGVFRAIQQG